MKPKLTADFAERSKRITKNIPQKKKIKEEDEMKVKRISQRLHVINFVCQLMN